MYFLFHTALWDHWGGACGWFQLGLSLGRTPKQVVKLLQGGASMGAVLSDSSVNMQGPAYWHVWLLKESIAGQYFFFDN